MGFRRSSLISLLPHWEFHQTYCASRHQKVRISLLHFSFLGPDPFVSCFCFEFEVRFQIRRKWRQRGACQRWRRLIWRGRGCSWGLIWTFLWMTTAKSPMTQGSVLLSPPSSTWPVMVPRSSFPATWYVFLSIFHVFFGFWLCLDFVFWLIWIMGLGFCFCLDL